MTLANMIIPILLLGLGVVAYFVVKCDNHSKKDSHHCHHHDGKEERV